MTNSHLGDIIRQPQTILQLFRFFTLCSIVGRHLEDMAALKVCVGHERVDSGQEEMDPVKILGHCQEVGFPIEHRCLCRVWVFGVWATLREFLCNLLAGQRCFRVFLVDESCPHSIDSVCMTDVIS